MTLGVSAFHQEAASPHLPNCSNMLTRTEFLQRLIPLIGLGQLSYRQAQSYRKIYLFQSFVAGFRFYNGMQLLHLMGINDPLELRREPENKHDKFAIALYWQQEKIGYLPAEKNELIARLIDAQALPLIGFITHINYEVKPWENLAMAVGFLQPRSQSLAAHARYLTAQQNPIYRTRPTKSKLNTEVNPALPNVLEVPNRVIALNSIEHPEVRTYFKKHYYDAKPLTVQGEPYALVGDDGIYNYMYEITATGWVKADDGETYLAFDFTDERPWD